MFHYNMFVFFSIQDDDDMSEYEEEEEDELKKRKRIKAGVERKKPWTGVSYVSNTLEHSQTLLNIIKHKLNTYMLH